MDASENLVAEEDAAFDRAYPDWVRRLSERYWTPVAVARRAATLLVRGAETRVLDVGAGAGKFCIVGAQVTGARFCGVEQDKQLVEVARRVCRDRGVDAARFIHGDAKAIDWLEFDAFYLFNPFTECWTRTSSRERRGLQQRRLEDIEFTVEMLRGLPRGARVVTFHGFGDPMPLEYRRQSVEFFGSDRLELWLKEE